MVSDIEYSAIEVRSILQNMFPKRKLVLSQITFFNRNGVCEPTGKTFKRGRRRYRLADLLSVVTVLALKEKGIPLKNISSLPTLLKENATDILSDPTGYQVSGYAKEVSLTKIGDVSKNDVLTRFLNCSNPDSSFFWSFDLPPLISKLLEVSNLKEAKRAA